MSTKVSKSAIGAFVIGAVAVLVIGIVVMGSGKLFTRKHTYITYFDSSVKGLSIGSPVTFHGVKVGSVDEIGIIAEAATQKLRIPVVFSLDPEKFKGARKDLRDDPQAIKIAVDAGLRTQLQSISFVTGQLMVSLVFNPEKPAVYSGIPNGNPEIPSIPAPLEEIQKTFENLPFKEIVYNLNKTLASVNQLVNSIDGKKTSKSIEATMQETRSLVKNINSQIGPLAASINKTSGSADKALNESRETMASVRGDMKELTASMKNSLEAARLALKQSEETMQTYAEDSRLVTEMNKTLRELSAASRSLRTLSDYLERHPEALISGKSGSKGD